MCVKFKTIYVIIFYDREEVLREQFGIRLQSSSSPASTSGAGPSTSNNTTRQQQQQLALSSIVGASSSFAASALLGLDEDGDPPQEVSPEFLAALPEDVQREVTTNLIVFLLIFLLMKACILSRKGKDIIYSLLSMLQVRFRYILLMETSSIALC